MRRPLLAVAALCLAATLGACGSGSSPADAVPALAEGLDRVDAAIEDGDDQAAREALTALVADSRAAAQAGDLDQDDADAVIEASRALLDQLEVPEEPEQPEQPEEPEAPVTPVTPDEPDESDEEEPDEEEPEDPEEDGKPDKPDKGPKPGKGHDRDD